jgi:hypothetical protein
MASEADHDGARKLHVRTNFGFGLLISGMTQPSKVLEFFDIFGRWDPTLGFVMAAALGVSGVGFSLLRQRTKPVLASALNRPGFAPETPEQSMSNRGDLDKRSLISLRFLASRSLHTGEVVGSIPTTPTIIFNDLAR